MGEVLGAGSDNLGGLSGDEGTVGVADKAGVSVASGVGDGGDGKGETLGGEVVGLGSLDSGLIDGHDGAVGVGDEAGVGGGIAVVASVAVGTVVGIGVST